MAKVVVGMLGFGTVGTGVIRILDQHSGISLKKVAVRELSKKRALSAPCPITANPSELVDDPEIEIIIEVMGGERPALDLLTAAIEKRKHIVTANKEVLAKHGPELFKLAASKGVAIFCEASVAGGIPLISTIHKGLEANQISSVTGILNGTTNFILSSMEEKGEDFNAALAKAQELGYAEADPTADIEGFDVAYKLSILTALAFGHFANPKDINRKGITSVMPEDFKHARDFGYRIKLLGSTSAAGDAVDVRVRPSLVPILHPLANVSGANNGIVVDGDAVGELMMVGPGAGELPTASAVVGDLINLASALKLPDFASYFQAAIEPGWAKLAPAGDRRSAYYLRIEVHDHPGVIGQIGTIFGDHHLSIRNIVQQGVSYDHASIIIITQDVKEANMEEALAELSKKEFLKTVAACMPIYAAGGKHA
ncbi:MAG: homoserine dehydrogenase [Candidatus Obscuribacterales bacterium]|jgi:homoserine dehydrogenase|nr:homoserine dehydrogenase [Candidatus Obscuribacterales bacterium]